MSIIHIDLEHLQHGHQVGPAPTVQSPARSHSNSPARHSYTQASSPARHSYTQASSPTGHTQTRPSHSPTRYAHTPHYSNSNSPVRYSHSRSPSKHSISPTKHSLSFHSQLTVADLVKTVTNSESKQDDETENMTIEERRSRGFFLVGLFISWIVVMIVGGVVFTKLLGSKKDVELESVEES